MRNEAATIYNIAKLPPGDREALFRNTAQKISMNEAIVEKDFWVCLTLDYLFHKCKWKSSIAFKGGTSLSKGYGLIKRFSEDIDLILDWRILGYGINEPWQERSNNKQDLFNKEANKRTEDFLKGEFIGEIVCGISEELQQPANLYIDNDDQQTIKFVYPQSFSNQSILQEIRLEIGTLAAWTPATDVSVCSYAAEQYPKLFTHPSTMICTVAPERTFWEKVTILHREAYRTSGNMPQRYSRHYYDLYCMSLSDMKEKALNNTDLLEKVVAFKDKFYRCSWARYDEACPGTIKLLPPEGGLVELEEDYLHMKNMIFGETPSFDKLIGSIKKLEDEINGL